MRDGIKTADCIALAATPRYLQQDLHDREKTGKGILVERWFREITGKRLRRGSFENVPALIAAIKEYLDNHNQTPQVFVWSAPVDQILTKIAKCKEALDALH